MGAGVHRGKERGNNSSFALNHACMPSPVHLWHWVIEFLPHITHSINWDVSQKMSGDCLQLRVPECVPPLALNPTCQVLSEYEGADSGDGTLSAREYSE
jgi:hypothetical protein